MFVGAFFSLVGLIFVGVAILAVGQDRARVAGLQSASAIQLGSMTPGQEVLIEGRIDERAQPRFRKFVAYVREEYRGNDSSGNRIWQEDEQVTPRLLVVLPDGRVQIVNQDYLLGNEQTVWQEGNVVSWNSLSGEGTKRYRGFEAGAPVLAIGSAARDAEFPAISVEQLVSGTRASYLADQRTLQLIMGLIGGLCFVVGAALLIFTLRRRGRQRRA